VLAGAGEGDGGSHGTRSSFCAVLQLQEVLHLLGIGTYQHAMTVQRWVSSFAAFTGTAVPSTGCSPGTRVSPRFCGAFNATRHVNWPHVSPVALLGLCLRQDHRFRRPVGPTCVVTHLLVHLTNQSLN
jgi:hypothetical protein